VFLILHQVNFSLSLNNFAGFVLHAADYIETQDKEHIFFYVAYNPAAHDVHGTVLEHIHTLSTNLFTKSGVNQWAILKCEEKDDSIPKLSIRWWTNFFLQIFLDPKIEV